MRINDWLALEEKYKFKFPGDFFSLYRELERTRVVSDWESDGLPPCVQLAIPDEAEQWWNRTIDPDLLPIISLASGDHICLRLPYNPDDPPMWVQCSYETNYRASLGRSFGGVVRVLAAYMDAWSFDCSTDREMEKAAAFLQRSRQVPTDVKGLMDDKERERLIHLRFWPRFRSNSPVVSNLDVVIPSFQYIHNTLHTGKNALKWAEMDFGRILKEDPAFGAGRWRLGIIYSLSKKVADACRELSLTLEGDIRTAAPVIDYDYTAAYGGPMQADFSFAAKYLRKHEAEYRGVIRNQAVASIILSDGFDKMGTWLGGLASSMRKGAYDEARPIAQSLLASYTSDEWFGDSGDVDQFEACTNALATIYAAAGLECRVNGVGE